MSVILEGVDESKFCVVCDNTASHDRHGPDGDHRFRPPAEQGDGTTKEESLGPPALDRAMFHGILGEIVAATEPTTEADPIGVYVSLLAGAGVIIGPSPHVQVGNIRHPLLVWPLLFGRTGSGRKGEATGTAELFLLSSSADSSEFTVSGLSSGEGLIERLRDPDPDNCKDTGGTSDKRLLVIEPEFSTVMARAKREGSTLAAVMRQGWDGKALSVLNRRALKASSSHMAIIGHITPKEFRLRLAESEMSGGSYNRFLPVYVERSKRLPIPEGVNPKTVSEMGATLRARIAGARKVTRIKLARSGTELWRSTLYEDLTESDDEDQAWSEFTRRAAPYCLRIAGLLAVLEGKRVIGDVELKAAGLLVNYSITSAKYVLGPRRDPRFDRIVRAIGSAGDLGLTRTQISQLFSRNLSKKVLDDLLAEVVADGRHREVKESTARGRPAVRYILAKETK